MSTYPPIPRHLFEMRRRWLDQAQAHAKDPKASPPDHTLLAAGLGEWGGPLQPTSAQDDGRGSVHDLGDGNGPFMEVILKRRRAEEAKGPRTPRILDPEGFFIAQAHIFAGGGLSLGRSKEDANPLRKDYLIVFSAGHRAYLARLIANTPREFQARRSVLGHLDYRRSGFPDPRSLKDVVAAGLETQGASAGREYAIGESLRLFDTRDGAAALGIGRAAYEQMLRDGYMLVDRLPLRSQQTQLVG